MKKFKDYQKFIPEKANLFEKKYMIPKILTDVEEHIETYTHDDAKTFKQNMLANVFELKNEDVKSSVVAFAKEHNFKVEKINDTEDNFFAVVPETTNTNIVKKAATEKETEAKDLIKNLNKNITPNNLGELAVEPESIQEIINRFDKNIKNIANNNNKADFYTNSIAQITEFDKLLKGQFPDQHPNEAKQYKNDNAPVALKGNEELDWVKNTLLYKRVYKEWSEYYKKLYKIPAYIPNLPKSTSEKDGTNKNEVESITKFDAEKNKALENKIEETRQLIKDLTPYIANQNQQAIVSIIPATIEAIADNQNNLKKIYEAENGKYIENESDEKVELTPELDNGGSLFDETQKQEPSAMPSLQDEINKIKSENELPKPADDTNTQSKPADVEDTKKEENSKKIEDETAKPTEDENKDSTNNIIPSAPKKIDDDLTDDEVKAAVEKELCKIGRSCGLITGALKKISENPKTEVKDLIASNLYAYYSIVKKDRIKTTDESNKKIAETVLQLEVEIDEKIEHFCDAATKIYKEFKENDILVKNNKKDVKRVCAETVIRFAEENKHKTVKTQINNLIDTAIKANGLNNSNKDTKDNTK